MYKWRRPACRLSEYPTLSIIHSFRKEAFYLGLTVERPFNRTGEAFAAFAFFNQFKGHGWPTGTAARTIATNDIVEVSPGETSPTGTARAGKSPKSEKEEMIAKEDGQEAGARQGGIEVSETIKEGIESEIAETASEVSEVKDISFRNESRICPSQSQFR